MNANKKWMEGPKSFAARMKKKEKKKREKKDKK
jgi:hypothetical protein